MHERRLFIALKKSDFIEHLSNRLKLEIMLTANTVTGVRIPLSPPQKLEPIEEDRLFYFAIFIRQRTIFRAIFTTLVRHFGF